MQRCVTFETKQKLWEFVIYLKLKTGDKNAAIRAMEKRIYFTACKMKKCWLSTLSQCDLLPAQLVPVLEKHIVEKYMRKARKK